MAKRPANLTSYSEMSTLGQCEMRWHLRYREGMKSEQSDAMLRGTGIHRCAAAWWDGEGWGPVLQLLVAEAGGGDPWEVDLDGLTEEPWSTVNWLMKRYVEHYGSTHNDIEVVAQELDLRAKVPGTPYWHQAIIDEVWRNRDTDELWVVERKTYGRRDRLDLVEYDPQLTLNLWVAQQNDIPAVGIVFDGIYTFRWKPERPTQAELIPELELRHKAELDLGVLTKKGIRELAKVEQERHPGKDRAVSESFDQLWLDRSPEQIGQALVDLKAGLSRRQALKRGAKPVRNVGPLCKGCGTKDECFSRLAFPTGDIELIGT